MKMVIMVDKSNGNESVGDMWTETHIFDSSATLKEVYDTITPDYQRFESGHIEFMKNVRIQIGREKETKNV